jgi:hypothetical protein
MRLGAPRELRSMRSDSLEESIPSELGGVDVWSGATGWGGTRSLKIDHISTSS